MSTGVLFAGRRIAPLWHADVFPDALREHPRAHPGGEQGVARMRSPAAWQVPWKYSGATSGDLDLEHLAAWACRKGIGVVGTGDFTHPAWCAELKQKLVPAEPGLYRLR